MPRSLRARGWVARFVLAAVLPVASLASAEVARYGSGFVGVMTTGSWYETLRPWDVTLEDSYMLGGALGWDRPIGDSRFRIGVEAQVMAHTGRQDHFELSVPLVLRYAPNRSRLFRSAAAGLGLSYATKEPQVEIDRNGASQRLFVHWMAEVEFGPPEPATTGFLRIHHRSDGYGLFEVDAGSTAYILGIRKRF